MSNQEHAGDGRNGKDRDDKKTVTIVVNGRRHEVRKGELTFTEIVMLANLPTGPNIVYTVTYRKGDGHRPEGSLVEGESVRVKNGMIFNVTATDKS
jgi:hypothetical protein